MKKHIITDQGIVVEIENEDGSVLLDFEEENFRFSAADAEKIGKALIAVAKLAHLKESK